MTTPGRTPGSTPDEHAGHADPPSAIDPVCGMTVDPGVALARGLQATAGGVEYFFCGRGCRLDFEEDPARFLDPAYRPSM